MAGSGVAMDWARKCDGRIFDFAIEAPPKWGGCAEASNAALDVPTWFAVLA